MDFKRVKAVGKLFLLFGTPLLVVLGLFGSGVYYGHLYRHSITSFEHEWLGLDVEVAPAPDDPDEDKDKDKAEEDDDGPDRDQAKDPAESSEPSQKSSDPPKAEPDPVEPVSPSKSPESEPSAETPAPTVPPSPAVAEAPPPPPEPRPEAVVPEMTVDPLDGALAERLETSVVVSVKVLVDDALVEKHPDWIDYVQRTVSRASAVYDKQFGIQLELASVGRWGVATEGMSAQGLLDDMQGRPRESASIVVGLTERPFDDRTSGKAFTPAEDEPFNGSAAVVYANPRHHDAHLRTLLHEVGHLFGALDIVDPRDPNFQSGSWMSYAPVPQGRAPWIDPANRARVLARKDKPFAPRTVEESTDE